MGEDSGYMFKRKSNKKRCLEVLNSGGVYWKDVLHQLYLKAPIEISAGKIGWSDNHPIAKKLKISGQELSLAVDFLKRNALVDTYLPDENTLFLSKKGFELALQNEQNWKTERTQILLLTLTYILALASMFTFLSSLDLIYNSYFYQNMLAIGFTIGLISGGTYLSIKAKRIHDLHIW